MKDPTTIARNVRADIRNATDHGTLNLPPCANVTVRVDRRGIAPSVNVYFSPADTTATDDVNAWKYTTNPDGIQTLSDAVKTAGTAILQMIKVRSGGSCYGAINCHGTIIAIVIPGRND